MVDVDDHGEIELYGKEISKVAHVERQLLEWNISQVCLVNRLSEHLDEQRSRTTKNEFGSKMFTVTLANPPRIGTKKSENERAKTIKIMFVSDKWRWRWCAEREVAGSSPVGGICEQQHQRREGSS